MAWLAAALVAQAMLSFSRRGAQAADVAAARRRVLPVVTVEHVAFAAALAAGLALMLLRGWGPGQARWFGLKLGLVTFLLLPLEAMHAWVVHWWIRPGLREGPSSRLLERGIGMDEMLRALAIPLLGLAVPLLLWLSLARPF